MCRLICITLMVLALPLFAGPLAPKATNAGLTLYVVSEEKIDGGRFIDTPDLPKVGYISAKPDLAVTNLEDVYPQKFEDNATIADKDSNYTVVPSHSLPALAVKLRAEDAKQFMALTERSIGKRLLIVLGDKPLTAPKIMMPIESGSFLIEFRNEEDLKRTEADLKKLVR